MLEAQVTTPFKAGATPLTFDGAARIVLGSKASMLRALILSNSLSAYTTDEGAQMLVEMSGDFKTKQFSADYGFHSGPATNHAAYGQPPTIIPIKQKVAGGDAIDFNISGSGATQTGTFDACIGVLYDGIGGAPSQDVLAKMPILVAANSGVFNYDAVAATTRQVLDAINSAQGGAMTIPAGAKEIIGVKVGVFKDGAVTAAQNVDGYIDLWSSHEIGNQEYPMPSIMPGLLASS